MGKARKMKERTVVTKCYKAIRRPSGYVRDNLPKRMKLRRLIERVRGVGWNMPLMWSHTWAVYCLQCAAAFMWVEEASLEQQFEDMRIEPEMG